MTRSDGRSTGSAGKAGLQTRPAALLLVAAEAREFSGLLPHCRKLERLRWPVEWARTAELNGLPVVLVANGAGPRRAAAVVSTARERMTAAAVVSTGFCGALEPGLGVGDIFVATRLKTGAEETPVSVPQVDRPFASGVLISIDRVAQTAAEKQELRLAGGLVVEMEAAGVALRVREWGLPFYCVRSVTDVAGEEFALDFNAVRLPDGRFSAPRIVRAALRRPMTGFPELLRLKKRTERAAQSLGEFLANCRF